MQGHGLLGARDWQAEAYEEISLAWGFPGTNPLVAGCPGCGKTFFGCAMAKHGREEFGSDICVCVSPTVNVRDNWYETFALFGMNATSKVSNLTLKERLHYGESLIEDRHAICITYAQLAREPDLYVEMLRRHNGCLIADEPHHADQQKKYGEALNRAAEVAHLRLALTGTPFNTAGTPLAMIDSTEIVMPDGRRALRSKPTYEYTYARAIDENVCRPVEFITVMGRGEVTFRSLLNEKEWKKVIDLAEKNAKLTHILAPEGGFMTEMLETGLKALVKIKETDPKAAMLVAVMDIQQATAVENLLITEILPAHPEWRLRIPAKIVHDTDGASERITRLRTDHTDIVIAVRMISEGVDVPRLRVGVFASNYLTRMFFIQLVGRFVRYEKRLDDQQFAQVVIPAHPDLLEYAREIERMINESLIPPEGEGGGGKKSEPYEIVGRETSATGKGAILRGENEDDITLADELFRRSPAARGRITDSLATQLMRDLGIGISSPGDSRQTDGNFGRSPGQKPPGLSVRKRNERLVWRIAREMASGKPDSETYKRIHTMANQAVGIRGVDDLTTELVLERRAEFLRAYLEKLYQGGAQ